MEIETKVSIGLLLVCVLAISFGYSSKAEAYMSTDHTTVLGDAICDFAGGIHHIEFVDLDEVDGQMSFLGQKKVLTVPVDVFLHDCIMVFDREEICKREPSSCPPEVSWTGTPF